jgi:hypothetical protein
MDFLLFAVFVLRDDADAVPAPCRRGLPPGQRPLDETFAARRAWCP